MIRHVCVHIGAIFRYRNNSESYCIIRLIYDYCMSCHFIVRFISLAFTKWNFVQRSIIFSVNKKPICVSKVDYNINRASSVNIYFIMFKYNSYLRLNVR